MSGAIWSSLEVSNVAYELPFLGALLTGINDVIEKPIAGCPHLTGSGKFGRAYACVHHLRDVGLLCVDCAARHIASHSARFENQCDGGCGQVCLGERIGALGMAKPAANYRLRRRGRFDRVRLTLWAFGLGLCRECAGRVAHHEPEWAS